MNGTRKMRGFYWSSALGFLAFAVLAFRMQPESLITLTQFYFGYQGIVAAGFFGFNFGEHWAEAKKINGTSKN